MKYLMQKILLVGMLIFFSGVAFSQKTISEHVDKLAKNYVKKKRNHSLVIGIIRGDETIIKSYGQMSKTDYSLPDGNTVFEIGAITSVFTTSLMQIQADKNVFQKHEPVSQYIKNGTNIPSFYPLKCVNVNLVPDIDETGVKQQSIYRCFEDPSAKPECISFCDLATHISGLPYSPKEWFKWKPIGRNKYEDEFVDKSIDEYYNKLQGLKLEYPPSVKYIHSDFGIALLGNAMSDISKMPFETLLQKELLHPLKMKNTRMDFSNENEMRIAWGHNRKGISVPIWKFDAMAPAAGLKSTMNDLLIFANANLNPPNRAFENAFAEAQQNKVNVLLGKKGQATSMGYGWYTSTLTRENNLRVIWMNGGTGGFRSFLGFIKDTNTAVVILSNSSSNVDKMGFDILEILNADLKLKPTKKTTANNK